MVLKVTVNTPDNSATARPGQRTGQQVYSLELDRDGFGALLEALKSAGLDTSGINPTPQPLRGGTDSGQDSAASSTPFGQNLGAQESKDAKPGPPFVPAYRPAVITMASSTPATWALNPTYFATRETAEWIAGKYGTGEVVEVPFGGNGGPFQASDKEFHIKLSNGKTVNAGILAAYFDRNPEVQFPGVADKLIRDVLKNVA